MANIHALTLQAASTLAVTGRLYDDTDKSYGPFTFNVGTTAKTIREIAKDNSWEGTHGLPSVIDWSRLRAFVPSSVAGTINFNYSDGTENPNSVSLGALVVGSKATPPFDLAANAATPYESMLPVNPGWLVFGPRMAPSYAVIVQGGGSLAYDPTVVAPGETAGCLKFTAGGASGLQGYDYDVSHVDMTSRTNIGFWVYMPSASGAVGTTGSIEVLLSPDGAFASYWYGAIARSGLKDGWTYVQLCCKSGVHFTVGAGSPTWGEFPKMRFRFNAAAAGAVIWVGPIRYDATPKAAVNIVIDDLSTNAVVETLVPMMRARGLRGTGYVNKNMTTGAGDFYATVAQLIAAKDVLTYGSHAATHVTPGTRSFATWKQDEWEASIDWMLAQGLITYAELEWLTAAYPFGDMGGGTMTSGLESAAAVGIKAAYVVANGTPGNNLPGYGCSYRQHYDDNGAPVGSNTALNLPRYTVGGTGAAPFSTSDFDLALQRAIDTGSVLTLMFHHVGRTGATNNETTDVSTAHGAYVLDAIAAAVAAGTVEITTTSRLVKEATLWRRAHPGRS